MFPSMARFGHVHMPSLDGATGWLNSEPLAPTELRGHVVLVDFWTLTCINWLRTEPYIRAWSHAYRDDGLVVIGVHTPEFSFEREIDRIKRAIAVRAIDYPVAVDSDYGVWTAFANHYWPALYFVDKEGVIRDEHFGAGRYEESERVIQELLGIDRELVAVAGDRAEAPPTRRPTPRARTGRRPRPAPTPPCPRAALPRSPRNCTLSPYRLFFI